MSSEAKSVLRSFDLLPDADKLEVATEILRRSLRGEVPPLGDEDLVAAAEELFLELDRREALDG
jgi:hypothetical protein